jgi:hypothetical protein
MPFLTTNYSHVTGQREPLIAIKERYSVDSSEHQEGAEAPDILKIVWNAVGQNSLYRIWLACGLALALGVAMLLYHRLIVEEERRKRSIRQFTSLDFPA